MSDNQEPTRLVREATAAAMIGFKAHTLRKWRTMGKGPRYVRVGHGIRYPVSALEEFAGCKLEVPELAAKA